MNEPVDYSATVTYGVAPYFYYWSWRPCYKHFEANGSTSYVCESDYYQLASGWGVSSIRLTFPSDVNTADIAVEVRDSSADNYLTGADTVFVLGPAFLEANPNQGFRCSGPDGWYPWEENVRNPTTGQWEVKRYRRNLCTGAKEYPPTP